MASAENIQNHHTVVENPIVRKGIEVALAEMSHRSCNGTDPKDFNACAASHLRMLGAKDFVAIFFNLVETHTLAKSPDSMNLPSNVKQMPKRN